MYVFSYIFIGDFMLKKILKKIYFVTLICFILLSVATIPTIKKDNTLRTNLEIEDIAGIKTNKVYLLNKNNYLTKVDIFLNQGTKKENVERIINYLKESNKEIDSSFKGYIPDKTEIIDMRLDEKTIYLNLSQDFIKDKDKINIIVPGLVHSILEIEGIEYVSLEVNNNYLEGYSKPMTKSLPINMEYSFTNRNNINKVVIYYNDRINEEDYFIPVTKYINDDREKIEIIVDELKENIPKNLISYLNSKTELLNYNAENNVLELNFNKYLVDDKKETTLQTLAYSVFQNYDIESILLKIDGRVEEIINNDIK